MKHQRIGECKCCGECCRNLFVIIEEEVDTPKNNREKLTIIKKIKQKETKSFKKKGFINIKPCKATWVKKNELKITFDLTCPHLEEKTNFCKINDNKPNYCKIFPTYDILPLMKGCGYSFKKIKE